LSFIIDVNTNQVVLERKLGGYPSGAGVIVEDEADDTYPSGAGNLVVDSNCFPSVDNIELPFMMIGPQMA
jgi:hypothetical protein